MPPAAQQGLERLQQGGIDVVALDQYMPGLDGLETLERIMAIPDAPPVVFVTASQDSGDRRHRAEGRRRRLSGQGRAGRFHSAACRSPSTARCGRRELQQARDEAEAEVHASRDRYAALAAEREVLLREVNHRVGNSLQIIASLLHLQANSADAGRRQGGADQCDGPRRRGRAGASPALHLARSQERAAEPVSRRPAGRSPALGRRQQDVAADAARPNRSRSIPDRAVAIGIIVNELVMNAVKYAYPDGAGPIHVELKREGDDLVLSIADDGVGLNVKTDPRSTGMGQRIVTAMAAKLDASVERDPTHTGTRIVLRFRASRPGRPSPPQAPPRHDLPERTPSDERAFASPAPTLLVSRA